jgi:hypothetical protein
VTPLRPTEKSTSDPVTSQSDGHGRYRSEEIPAVEYAAAFLSRKHTAATLADLAPILGLSRPESVPNLTRKFSGWFEQRPDNREGIAAIERVLAARASAAGIPKVPRTEGERETKNSA